MFRGIVKGLGEIFKKRGSIELSELPKASDPIQQALDQNQLSPVQSGTQQNVSLANLSAATTQNAFKRSSTANSMARLSSSIGSIPSQFAEAKTSKLLSPENLVRVRIWSSKTEDGRDTYGANAVLRESNVGHATVETNKIYASIWPDWDLAINQYSAHPRYLATPEKDMESEAGPDGIPKKPDYIFEFYSLDVKAIEATFKGVEEAKDPWNLFGNSRGDKAYSCSSLTLSLLENGGLNKLASDTVRKIVSPTSNFIVTPNNLVNQLFLAKKIEEKKHPEVIDFVSNSAQSNSSKKEAFLVTLKAGKINISNIVSNSLSRTSENEALTNSSITTRRSP